mmetsp:Transcript_26855/g.55764  ORF Transcript_26855/g.55764 Transcript_26855/m.55764 type:complete len:437 (-) Transcript_26855:18-1328(-)
MVFFRHAERGAQAFVMLPPVYRSKSWLGSAHAGSGPLVQSRLPGGCGLQRHAGAHGQQQRRLAAGMSFCFGMLAWRRLAARRQQGPLRIGASLHGARAFASLTSLAAFGRKKAAAQGPSVAGRPRSLSSRYRDKLQHQSDSASRPAGGFVDTHCHLDHILPRLAREFQQDVQKARQAGSPPPQKLKSGFEGWRASLDGPMQGYEGCVHVGCTADTLDAGVAFLKHDGVHGAFGIHPLAAGGWSDSVEEKLWSLMGLEKVVAWGECGLDYFDKARRGKLKQPETIALQRHVFARQLELAAKAGMPLVVHTRDAEEDTLELMKQHLPAAHPVHVHCFTSSLAMAQELLGHFPRLCLGFTGVVTFSNAREVQEVVRQTPLERLLLETDGPYMAPEPYRGRVAHPGHVAFVAEGVAKVKGLAVEEVFGACRENTRRLYGF